MFAHISRYAAEELLTNIYNFLSVAYNLGEEHWQGRAEAGAVCWAAYEFFVQCIFIVYRISNAFLLKLFGAEECVQ